MLVHHFGPHKIFQWQIGPRQIVPQQIVPQLNGPRQFWTLEIWAPKVTNTVKQLNYYTQHCWQNMSNTNIFIGEYFKVEFILLLLDMLCQYFGEKLIFVEQNILEYSFEYSRECIFPYPAPIRHRSLVGRICPMQQSTDIYDWYTYIYNWYRDPIGRGLIRRGPICRFTKKCGPNLPPN